MEQGNVAANAKSLQVGAPVGDLTGNVATEEAVDDAVSGNSTEAFARLGAVGLL